VDSQIGSWTEIGKNTKILESTVGDYTYDAGDVMIVYTDVGKFCSIASHTRINPGNHPKWRVTQHHFTYRRAQFGFGQEMTMSFSTGVGNTAAASGTMSG
jgi:acetyltransferase-like isoleucine patch superfamily enzyme